MKKLLYSFKARIQGRKFIITALLPLLLLGSSCSRGEDTVKGQVDNKEAVQLLERVEELLKGGKKVEAAKVFAKLKRFYPDSLAARDGEQKLKDKGFSIKRPLTSETIERMIDAQNRINKFFQDNGRLPEQGELPMPFDAWGKPIDVQFFPRRKDYNFILYSKGGDGKKGSPDDVRVINSIDPSQDDNGEKRVMGTDGLVERLERKDRRSSDGGAMSLDSFESLLEKNGSGDGNMELTLEQFEEMAGEKH